MNINKYEKIIKFGMGNNPMVGATVAVEEGMNK